MKRYPRTLIIEATWPRGAVREQRERREQAARDIGALIVHEVGATPWRVVIHEILDETTPIVTLRLTATLTPID